MDILKNVNFWQNVVLVATLIFMIVEIIRQRKESQRVIYQELHSGYLSFLQFNREHPEIGLSEFDDTELKSFEVMGGNKGLLDACNYLVALGENAFLIRSSMSKGQWEGWETWMEDYLRRYEKVRKGVNICVEWYDPNFVKYMRNIIAKIEKGN